METEQQPWLPGLEPGGAAWKPREPEDGKARRGDLWAAYRETMARPLTADEARSLGERKETGPSVTPFADIEFVNRRGRRSIRTTVGVKGTF